MEFSELPHILAYTMKNPCAGISAVNYYIRQARFGRMLHKHDIYQYLLVTDGTVTVEYNGEVHTLSRGQFSLIPPGVEHVIYTETGYTQMGVDFWSNIELPGLMQQIETHFKEPVIGVDRRFAEKESEFVPLMVTGSVVAQSRVILLCLEALTNMVENIIYDGETNFDTRLSYYLESRLDERLTTKQIAEHFHMSVPQLERLSRRYFGSGVVALYNQKRLVRARTLLNNTEKSISEIAQETGFYDASHFSGFFSRLVGMSPSKWRKRKGWESLDGDEERSEYDEMMEDKPKK